MYSIYSLKNKKLGELDITGKLNTVNSSLRTIYENLLKFGVYFRSIYKKDRFIEILREQVFQKDGEKFVKALVKALKDLGFIIKKR